MTTLLALLEAIPNVIWSGIVASLLTLGGVLLSNRDSTNRLKLQLQHDAAEKSKERIATLRRDVYFRTVEELVKANAHLAGLPQKDLAKENFGDGLQDFFSASARLQLVAEPETALLVAQLQADYGELAFDLMTHLLPVSKAKIDIQIADNLYNKAQTEVTRLLADMAKQNESGNPDPKIFQSLQLAFEFQQGQSQKFGDDCSQAWHRFNESSIEFQRFLFTRIKDLGPKQIPVLVAIRRDLGLTGDLQEFEAEMRRQILRNESKLDALISNLRAG